MIQSLRFFLVFSLIVGFAQTGVCESPAKPNVVIILVGDMCYAAHEQRIYGFVFSLLHNRSDTDDGIQEAMAQLWEHFEDYDRAGPFFPWACRFAYRKVLMHRRREGARRIYLSEEALDALAQDYPGNPDWEESCRRALKSCMSKLTERQAELLAQRSNNGLEQEPRI